jgi:hypothetical protein
MSISRVSLCSFTFADGRRCRTPRSSKHLELCYFHAKKEAEARSLQEIGYDIGTWLTGNYVSACDLSAALGRVFSNTAQGRIKPRTAATLGYLGQTIAQLIPRAQLEYVNTYGTDAWRAAIRCAAETVPGPAVRPPTSSSSHPAAAPDPSPLPSPPPVLSPVTDPDQASTNPK